MGNVLKMTFFILTTLWFGFVQSQELTETTRFATFNYTLDTKEDSGVPWSFSMHFDGWFSYHESPTDFNLIGMEKVEGVWASFYNDLPPYFGHPSPFIEFATSFQSVQSLELQYYIHGTGNITLEGGVEDVIEEIDPDDAPTWKTYTSNLTSISFVKFWLNCNEPGDFILIDYISFRGYGVVLPSPITPSTTTVKLNSTTTNFENSSSTPLTFPGVELTNSPSTDGDGSGINSASTFHLNGACTLFLIMLVKLAIPAIIM